MSAKKRPTLKQNRLRQKAESSLVASGAQGKKMTAEEAQELVHELQVHHIELEMQNEELRQAQLELEVARDLYASLFDHTPVGYVTLDEQGKIREANLTFCTLLGVPRSELLRRKFEEFLDQADQPAFRAHVQVLKMKPGIQSSDILTLRHQTNLHRVRLESSLETMNPPATEHLYRMTVIDVTERERMRKLQEEQKVLLEGLFGGVMDAIVITDEEERIVLFNRAAEKIFRYPASSVIGQNMDRFIPERFRKAHHLHHEQFMQMAESHGPLGFSREITALRTDGEEFSAEITVSTVEAKGWGSQSKKLYAVVLRDITERREAQEALGKQHQELQALSAQLLTAQEEERRRISRDLHDDVNQRLALLSLKLQMAQQTLSDDQAVRPLLQELEKSVGELSDDIRHLAFQYHPSVLDDLGLSLALRSLCEDFAKWEKMQITCELPEGTRNFSQNVASCLYRVAQESLRNISKHAGASSAHLVLKEDKRDITFSIRDNGRGFSLQGNLPQGLGFVSMTERARLMGGTLSVESSPGEGTTVRVTIPKRAAPG